MCRDHNVLTLILIEIFSGLKIFTRKYFAEDEILVSLAIMKKLQFIGAGFITTQNATTKMSIVNMVQKILQIFFYSVAEIV